MEKDEGIMKERSLSAGLMSSPALKFITRKDLYSFLNSAGVCVILVLACGSMFTKRYLPGLSYMSKI
jgi:hypothetical protein